MQEIIVRAGESDGKGTQNSKVRCDSRKIIKNNLLQSQNRIIQQMFGIRLYPD